MRHATEEATRGMVTFGRIDGIVLKFPAMHREHYSGLVEELRAQFGAGKWEDLSHSIRVKLFNMNSDGSVKVVKVGFYGEAAVAAEALSSDWVQYIDEVHHKAFIEPVADDAMAVLRRELDEAPSGRKVRLTRNPKGKRGEGAEQRGWSVGDKDSAYEFTGYRRSDRHRFGIEVKIKGDALRRITDEQVKNDREFVAQGLSTMAVWFVAKKLARRAWAQFFREMDVKRVDLGDYVDYFTYVAEADITPPSGYNPATGLYIVNNSTNGQSDAREVYHTLEAYFERDDDAF